MTEPASQPASERERRWSSSLIAAVGHCCRLNDGSSFSNQFATAVDIDLRESLPYSRCEHLNLLIQSGVSLDLEDNLSGDCVQETPQVKSCTFDTN